MLRISIEMASVLIYIYGYMIEEISQIMQMDIDLTVIPLTFDLSQWAEEKKSGFRFRKKKKHKRDVHIPN